MTIIFKSIIRYMIRSDRNLYYNATTSEFSEIETGTMFFEKTMAEYVASLINDEKVEVVEVRIEYK